jgi:hypothetical protein
MAPRGFLTEIGDQRRHDIQRALVSGDLGLLNDRRQLALGPVQSAPPAVIFHP